MVCSDMITDEALDTDFYPVYPCMRHHRVYVVNLM